MHIIYAICLAAFAALVVLVLVWLIGRQLFGYALPGLLGWSLRVVAASKDAGGHSDAEKVSDLTTEFQQRWYNVVKARFGYSQQLDRFVIDSWLRRQMEEWSDGNGNKIHAATIANVVPSIVARAMVPNRSEVAAAGYWRGKAAQQQLREYRSQSYYGFFDWLVGMERPYGSQ